MADALIEMEDLETIEEEGEESSQEDANEEEEGQSEDEDYTAEEETGSEHDSKVNINHEGFKFKIVVQLIAR